MKFGVRKPSIKKSIKARTTGKIKRSLKKSIDPTYGKKGIGLIKNPKKAAYNKVYKKTTFSFWDLFKSEPQTKLSKQEINMYAIQAQDCLQIYEDSRKLFSETLNPNVFFMRYHLAIEQLEQLQLIIDSTNNAINYRGSDIQEMLTLLKDKQADLFKDFINRYCKSSEQKASKLKTDKGKRNNLQRSKEKLLEQAEYLNEEEIILIENLWK